MFKKAEMLDMQSLDVWEAIVHMQEDMHVCHLWKAFFPVACRELE